MQEFGSTGSTGVNGNSTNGSAGGAAGNYIRGLSFVTLTQSGTVQGVQRNAVHSSRN